MNTQERKTQDMVGEGSIMGQLDVLRRRTMEEGALPRQTKELIALAVAIRGGNDTSIAYHVHNAMEAGCSVEQISETVDIAAVASGESTAVHAVQVQKALSEHSANEDDRTEVPFRRFAQVYEQ